MFIEKIERILDVCKGARTQCDNGGFVHPRNCSKCICPSGYGGALCNERPAGCGTVQHATRNWTILEDKLNGSKAGPDGFIRCNYWIKAPPGKGIEVEVMEVPVKYGVDGCTYAGVEIKTHPDPRRTGYRFCTNSFVGTKLMSNASTIPVITFILEDLLKPELLPDDYFDQEYEEENDDGSDEEHRDEDENQLPSGVKLKYRHL
ncbi:hypothetical protein TELCIR_07770 [Teladorsagia circumcincta]|uniref:CUB domain-containing protein n=1 Tax=Teladorsagia circumcincta TaxID=45464 RepID=A0A2G9UJG8_TELCI|nr:hypothetical protein TELCIR_07770 [Teladorsagia circumcincta]